MFYGVGGIGVVKTAAQEYPVFDRLSAGSPRPRTLALSLSLSTRWETVRASVSEL